MASNETEILDPAVSGEKLKKIAAGRALNRRHFLAALSMTSAAAGAGLMSGCSTSNSVASTSTSLAETDYLNFILNLKYVEATFYSFITQGKDLASNLIVNSGAITGAPSAALTFTATNAQQITDMLNEIYYDEINHLSVLISLTGASGIHRPAINLAAFGAITASNALAIARLLEDVGVTAMTGAAPNLSTSILTLTSQILGVESFHGGAVRLVDIQNPSIATYISAGPLDVPPYDPGSGSTAAAGPTASGGFFATAGASTTTSTTPAGFPYARTTSQVLAILYGAPGAPAAPGTSSGGFLPSGANGNIHTV